MEPYYADESVTVHHGDCLDVLRDLPDASVDAVVTDPPYLLGFMGRAWDTKAGHEHLEWHGAWARECLRLLKPGGHLLAFGGSRTWHRLACAVEDAGFEVRDSIAWIHSQGFPKGKGQLKPAFEPVVVARKAGPIWLNIDGCRVAAAPGDYAHPGNDNRAMTTTAYGKFEREGRQAPPHDAGRWPSNVVLTHADGCAQAGTVTERVGGGAKASGGFVDGYQRGDGFVGSDVTSPVWRCVKGCQVAELDRQSGTLTSGANPTRRGSDKFRDAYGEFQGQEECVAHRGVDSGGASRFFPTFRYEAKAPAAERPSYVQDGAGDHRSGGNFAGGIRLCRQCGNRTKPGCWVPGDERPWPACGHDDWEWGQPKLQSGRVAHPTVKPLDLMRWLVRLVTPPGGLVLDPFAGSGTTAEACVIEGFRCITVEREAAYLPLIVARLSKPIQPDLFGGAA